MTLLTEKEYEFYERTINELLSLREENAIWVRTLSRNQHFKSIKGMQTKEFPLRRMECSILNFPRIKYLYKMLQILEKNLKRTGMFHDKFIEGTPVIILYVSSYTPDDAPLLSWMKTGKNLKVQEEPWPSSVLVYFQQDFESLKEIDKKIDEYKQQKWDHVIVVSNSAAYGDLLYLGGGIYKTVQRDKKAIQEAISKCLETPLNRYLDLRKSDVEEMKGIDNSKLMTEIVSLQNMLSRASAQSPIRIPEKVKKFLFKLPFVESFGIWKGDTLRIIVKDITAVNGLEKALKSLDLEENYFQKISIEILEGRVQVKQYVGQGDKLFPESELNISGASMCCKTDSFQSSKTVASIYGTLGAFVEDSTYHSLFGITCRHVISKTNKKVFVI